MKKPRRTRVSATGEIKGYSDYITKRGIMKEKLLKVMALAYEVNDLMGLTFVSVDVSRYDATVHIHTLSKKYTSEKRTTYWAPMQYSDAPHMEGWVVDPGFEKAEAALKEILKGVQAA